MRRQLLVNGVLLALGLGTLGLVWLTREAPTTAELATRQGKLLPAFDKNAITRLRIEVEGQEVVLEPNAQAPGEFHIARPWQERADVATVNRLLGALDLASALRAADGASNEAAGLDHPPLRIHVETRETAQLIALGGPAPSPRGARYAEVRSDGHAARYVVSEGVASELTVQLDQLREPLLLEYGQSELGRVRIGRAGTAVELVQRERGAFFATFAEGPQLAARDGVERILAALSRLSADRFVKPEDVRREAQRRDLTVEIDPAPGQRPAVKLTFGGDCAHDGTRVALLREQGGRAPRAGCVPADVLPPLATPLEELRLLGPFAARTDEVEELRVRRQDQKYALLRKDAGFRLRAAVESEVPLDAGNERIARILQARGRLVATAERGNLGLDPPAGELFVQVTAGGGSARREERALLGARRADGSVCLERELDRVLLCYTADSSRLFEPDATLLRPLSLLSFAPSELATLTTISADFRQTVSRQGDGSYRLLEPAGMAHDGALVAEAVQALGTLSALRWVSLTDEPRFELGQPRLRVRFTLASGEAARELGVGAATDAGYYARLSPDPAVFLLSKAAFSDLSLPFLDRALCPFSGEDFARATLKWSGAGAVPQRTITFTSDGSEASQALRSLKAYRALHLGKPLPHEGFATPRLQITYRSTTHRTVEVLVGSCDTRDDMHFCYARRSDVDATFALSSQVVSDLKSAVPHDDQR